MNNLNGKLLGRYQLIEPVGQGGMAAAYKAFDRQTRQGVMVQVFSPGPQVDTNQIFQFQREAKKLAALAHPHIAQILDYGEQDGVLYWVMDHYPGGSLTNWEGQAMHWRLAARLLIPIAHALAYAHRHGVYHGGFDASCVMLNEAGKPVLTRFQLPGFTARLGDLVEPVDWMKLAVERDLYAFGQVFYELVTGVQLDGEVLQPPRAYVPDLPEDVENTIHRLLWRGASFRFSDMSDVSRALEVLLYGQRATQDLPRMNLKTTAANNRSGGWTLAVRVLVVTLLMLFMAGSVWTLSRGSTVERQVTSVVDIRPAESVPAVAPVTGGDTLADYLAVVTEVTGRVSLITKNGHEHALEKGMQLGAGVPFRLKVLEGEIQLQMKNGALVCMHPNTTADFSYHQPSALEAPDFDISLHSGRVMLVSSPEKNNTFSVQDPFPIMVVSMGAIIGIERTGASFSRLDLDCLDGACDVVSVDSRLALKAGDHTWVLRDGKLRAPNNQPNPSWAPVCENLAAGRIVTPPASVPASPFLPKDFVFATPDERRSIDLNQEDQAAVPASPDEGAGESPAQVEEIAPEPLQSATESPSGSFNGRWAQPTAQPTPGYWVLVGAPEPTLTPGNTSAESILLSEPTSGYPYPYP